MRESTRVARLLGAWKEQMETLSDVPRLFGTKDCIASAGARRLLTSSFEATHLIQR